MYSHGLNFSCSQKVDLLLLLRSTEEQRFSFLQIQMFFSTRRCLFDSYASASRQLRMLAASFGKDNSSTAHGSERLKRRREVAECLYSLTTKNGNRAVGSAHSVPSGYTAFDFKRNVSGMLREAKYHSAGALTLTCLEIILEDAVAQQQQGAAASSNGFQRGWLQGLHRSWLLDARASARNPSEARMIDIAVRRLASLAEGGDATLSDADEYGALIPSSGDSLQRADGSHPEQSALAFRADTKDMLGQVTGRAQREVVPNDSFQRYFLKQQLVTSHGALTELVRALNTHPLAVVRAHASSPLGVIASTVLERMQKFGSVAPPKISSRLQVQDAFVVLQNSTPGVSGEGMQRTNLAHATVRGLTEHKVCSVQSASSMLPALLVDVHLGERVLDLCAAPGSKTMLLMDQLARQQQAIATTYHNQTSLLCANDVSLERATALNDRIGGTEINVVVMSSSGEQDAPQRFDKVLVDAPCSGEGQMHRRAAEWRMWHPMRGVEFHKKQIVLLRQAAMMTNIGGTIVYSTCTLNPLENEAVVAAVVEEGLLEPIPIAPGSLFDKRTGQAFVPGLQQWSVPSPSGAFLHSSNSSTEAPSSLIPTLFPGYSADACRASVASCSRRVFPDLKGTNGQGEDAPFEAFFLVALRRVDRQKHNVAAPAALAQGDMANDTAPGTRKRFEGHHVTSSTSLQRSSLASTFGFRVVSCAFQVDVLKPLAPFFGKFMDASSKDFSGSLESTRRMLTRAQQELGVQFLQSARDKSVFIATAAAADFIFSSRSSSGNNTMLMACGARVLDGQGRLTEIGAQTIIHRLLLHTNVPVVRQVFPMPLREAQVLLSGKGTRVVPLVDAPHASDDPFAAGVANVRNLDGSSAVKVEDMRSSWRYLFVQHPERFVDGNAIAMINVAGDSTNAGNGVGGTAQHWAMPVTLRRCIVQGTPSMEIQSNLTPAATRRASGLLSTLQRSQRSFSTAVESARRRNAETEMMAEPSSPYAASVASQGRARLIQPQEAVNEALARLQKEEDTIRL
ncbi:Hypothetical protein, putative [Bodo saltans]|uniref:SAM-dependent MTase RsmB/NOP-type domain-containing protein n=1 Tax=Bodo saltans TaxID=75058 RepID=A0A0S4J7G4_BODSA|nr:Hypothetical protein, putative [Bodo saltans]|eukprot:CUG87177.1 Hypothetical protein, putative [Bodo saltans]